jgi:hypothetical protein
MNRRSSRLVAAAAALALLAQSTGAASLPALLPASGGAFFPPAARLGAFPPAAAKPAAAPAKAPAGPSWLESARIVAAFVAERVGEELNSKPAPPSARDPLFAPREARVEEPVRELAPGPAPASDPPADRMMVVMEPGLRVEAVIGDRFRVDWAARTPQADDADPILPPFREKWIERSGVRARVSYIGSHGIVRGDAAGFTAAYADGTSQRVSRRNPAALRRGFPIYFHGEVIEIQLTFQNRTGRALKNVRLEAVQEVFHLTGTEGRRLVPPVERVIAASLAPGATATVSWKTRLVGPGVGAVNLEQTHVRVTADGGDTALIDAPQAGLVDPPGPGML